LSLFLLHTYTDASYVLLRALLRSTCLLGAHLREPGTAQFVASF
jgi:hypothetical protein